MLPVNLILILLLLASSMHAFRPNTKLYMQQSSRFLQMKVGGESEQVPTSALEGSKSQLKNSIVPLFSTLALLAPQILGGQNAFAAEGEAATATAPVALGPPPTDFGLKYKDYYADCQQVVNHMRYAVQLEKGNPIIADVAQKTKDEMSDFVSYYRRFQGISGKQTFSLLYTSINVLAGHYTSYGVKFPVPEKRRKRLMQEFNDIEKNIKKRR